MVMMNFTRKKKLPMVDSTKIRLYVYNGDGQDAPSDKIIIGELAQFSVIVNGKEYEVGEAQDFSVNVPLDGAVTAKVEMILGDLELVPTKHKEKPPAPPPLPANIKQ